MDDLQISSVNAQTKPNVELRIGFSTSVDHDNDRILVSKKLYSAYLKKKIRSISKEQR
jgi:hypothetical protein